jgi:hypothetical protein
MSKNINKIREAFSYTTNVAGMSQDPTMGRSPFNVITGTGFLDNTITGIPTRDEKDAQAPKILPFPLDRIVDQLAKSYEELLKTKQTLLVTINISLLNSAEKEVLRKDVKEINKALEIIKKISKDMDTLTL